MSFWPSTWLRGDWPHPAEVTRSNSKSSQARKSRFADPVVTLGTTMLIQVATAVKILSMLSFATGMEKLKRVRLLAGISTPILRVNRNLELTSPQDR